MATILMNRKERLRLEVFSRVTSGELTLAAAAERLGLSYRQAKRIKARYQQEGDVGLGHRLRGRGSNRQSATATKERILTLYRQRYADHGPTLASECLAKEEQLSVSVSTLRRWLLAAGDWKQARKGRQHRRRRTRRKQCGELVQMDGSHHDWFEGRRGKAVLMVAIDDATGVVTASFHENESWHSAVELFLHYVRLHGLPWGLYVDRSSIYRPEEEPNARQLLAGEEPETQFGRAMRELGVELILANSPQAKGRVERMNGTLQDRLVKALRRAGINDLESANRFLQESFLPEFNQRFRKPAEQPVDGHRPLLATVDLSRILSIQEQRVVANDWTVRWHNRFLQLSPMAVEFVKPKGHVTVCQQLDGRLRLFVGDQELCWEPSMGPRTGRVKKPSRGQPTGSSQGHKPAAHHPWRTASIKPPLIVPIP